MIEKVRELRKEGLTFQKIAEELNTTIGKVRYQWKKYHQNEGKIANDKQPEPKNRDTFKLRIQETRVWQSRRSVPTEYLDAWLVGTDQLYLTWNLLDINDELISCYLNKPLYGYPKVLRVYDVIHAIFDVDANHMKEIVLKEGQEVLLVNELKPDSYYVVELGLKISNLEFFPLFRSTIVQTPGRIKRRQGSQWKTESVSDLAEITNAYSLYGKLVKKQGKQLD